VRVLGFALALIIAIGAATGVARADDDDEDGEFVPVPKRSVALSIGGHGTRIGGHSESGFGPSLELALGTGRWQYFGEGGFASTTVTTPIPIGGRMAHAGVGARWIARQFRPDSGGGVELYLLSRLGLQRFYLADGGRVGRPELAIGFGLQGRLYKRPRLAFRLDFRILLAPTDRESLACRGDCMTTTSTGFSTGVGFAW